MTVVVTLVDTSLGTSTDRSQCPHHASTPVTPGGGHRPTLWVEHEGERSVKFVRRLHEQMLT